MSNSPTPQDEPLAPKGAYSMDFDKFDDPNYNPFESKKAMRNSPPPSESAAPPKLVKTPPKVQKPSPVRPVSPPKEQSTEVI